MRHRVKKGRKLSRNSGQRNSLVNGLLMSLVEHGYLTTTVSKAKEVKREFDLLVNLAKRAVAHNNFTIKREIFSLLSRKQLGLKLFEEVLPKFGNRSSGYLNLVRTGDIRNDGAENIYLQFVKEENNGGKKEVPAGPTPVASNRRPRAAAGKTIRKNK
jgi:large subunit ribosomal protein L17